MYTTTTTPATVFFVFFFFQLNNPDMRVVILKDFVKKHFPTTTVMDYAIEVEKITTSKVTHLTLEKELIFLLPEESPTVILLIWILGILLLPGV